MNCLNEVGRKESEWGMGHKRGADDDHHGVLTSCPLKHFPTDNTEYESPL